ncbi:hypothetical protein M878_21305 [Streptomyces roseochromogenus subsp. oscitans DS 12.976]|uniref:Uncharacterized protein n=1 Tax=Streptomyces roseochromogenus subsp. oscitans DS 12.976 TaxID=1352936 RepID=V6KAD1_STRRC|nr:hypothetical protein M878_21305 [Streptomyces roseochromogenus subsp. oscitans DS 12.976]
MVVAERLRSGGDRIGVGRPVVGQGTDGYGGEVELSCTAQAGPLEVGQRDGGRVRVADRRDGVDVCGCGVGGGVVRVEADRLRAREPGGPAARGADAVAGGDQPRLGTAAGGSVGRAQRAAFTAGVLGTDAPSAPNAPM